MGWNSTPPSSGCSTGDRNAAGMFSSLPWLKAVYSCVSSRLQSREALVFIKRIGQMCDNLHPVGHFSCISKSTSWAGIVLWLKRTLMTGGFIQCCGGWRNCTIPPLFIRAVLLIRNHGFFKYQITGFDLLINSKKIKLLMGN